jgi:Tfp pilus assembly protein PilX
MTKESIMRSLVHNERGSALVTTLFFLLGLAVTGAIIAGIASSEKRVTYNEYAHTRSFHASDAGGEEALNWIRSLPAPTRVPNDTKVHELTTYSTLTSSYSTGENNRYKYDITFDRRRFRPGWTIEYKDYDFTVDTQGASAQESETDIEVQASRLFRDANTKY